MWREVESVQLAVDFVKIQPADVLRAPVQQGLAQEPAPLERVGRIHLIGAPDNITGDICGHDHTLSEDYSTLA